MNWPRHGELDDNIEDMVSSDASDQSAGAGHPSGGEADHKRALRAALRQRLMSLTPGELHDRSAAATRRLAETGEFRRAKAVMIFLPLRYEVDACPVALKGWQAGKVVTVPLVSYQQKHMIPVTLRSLDDPMDTDGYGVRTPTTQEPYPIELIDLVVVPGLGFDREGGRIGRGGGFYDRFLSQESFRGVACGLALSDQVIDSVPRHEHDVPLDMLVTDEGVLRFGGRREPRD